MHGCLQVLRASVVLVVLLQDHAAGASVSGAGMCLETQLRWLHA